MEKRWQKSELAYLKKHAKEKSVDELAHRFHTDAQTVLAKLEEQGLLSGGDALSGGDGPALELYEKALEHLHGQRWDKARDLFEAAAGATDNRQIIDRVAQFLEICRSRLDDPVAFEDPYLQAVYEKNRGEIDRALELCRQHGSEKDERFAYLLASLQALSSDDAGALETLESAIELDPRNRVHAYHDPDFDAIRGREEFHQLISAGG